MSGAIDSPLQNLAIYWQLMQTDYLGTETAPLDLPDDYYLNTAARGVGAANDKTGEVSVDMLVYINEIMGLTAEDVNTVLPKICINNIKEEVKGVVQTVRKCFLNYGPEALTTRMEAETIAISAQRTSQRPRCRCPIRHTSPMRSTAGWLVRVPGPVVPDR